MSRREKGPTRSDRQAEGRAVLESLPELSETMLEFAKPLLAQFPSPPPIEMLRQVLVLVTVAWNLPIYEQRRNPQAASFRATFDQAMAQVPPQIARILSAMLVSRLSTYANDPRTGFAGVVADGGGHAQVVATAALTDDWLTPPVRRSGLR
jgi:hypothetical protein